MKKFAGRPEGSANVTNKYSRNEYLRQQRVTEGFNKTLGNLKEVLPAGTSIPDILHDALREYGLQKLSKKEHIFWIKKIK